MLAPETYVERANEVLRMIETERDPMAVDALRSIAEAWLRLAEDAAERPAFSSRPSHY